MVGQVLLPGIEEHRRVPQASQIPAEIARYQDALTPAVILIPGKEGSLGIGMNNVKNAVERAVGADIL